MAGLLVSGSTNFRKDDRAGESLFFFRKGIMNAIITTSQQTMTSRQIAEAVGSDHHNVLATVRRLIKEGVISGNETPYTHPQNGQQYIEFQLDYRNTMVVASGYNAELRAKIIDRWLELERGAAPKLPQTFAQALRLAAEQAEVIEQQQAQIEAARPAVEFKEKYVNSSTGTQGFRDVCKLLRANERKFADFLKAEKIMYKLGREWMPYAQHLDTGRFEVKAGTNEANGHAYNRAKFTPKGVAWVAQQWIAYQLEVDTGKPVSVKNSANSQSSNARGAA